MAFELLGQPLIQAFGGFLVVGQREDLVVLEQTGLEREADLADDARALARTRGGNHQRRILEDQCCCGLLRGQGLLSTALK